MLSIENAPDNRPKVMDAALQRLKYNMLLWMLVLHATFDIVNLIKLPGRKESIVGKTYFASEKLLRNLTDPDSSLVGIWI